MGGEELVEQGINIIEDMLEDHYKESIVVEWNSETRTLLITMGGRSFPLKYLDERDIEDMVKGGYKHQLPEIRKGIVDKIIREIENKRKSKH